MVILSLAQLWAIQNKYRLVQRLYCVSNVLDSLLATAGVLSLHDTCRHVSTVYSPKSLKPHQTTGKTI